MPSRMLKSDNGPLPLAKGLACRRCKARKTRCSGERPACVACIRSARFKRLQTDNIVCVYNEESASQSRSSSLSSGSPNRSRRGTDSPPFASSSPIPAYAPFHIIPDIAPDATTASCSQAAGARLASNGLGNDSALYSIDPPDPYGVYVSPSDPYHDPLSEARVQPLTDCRPLSQHHAVLPTAQSELYEPSPHPNGYLRTPFPSYCQTSSSLPTHPPPETPNFNLAYSSLHRFADISATGAKIARAPIPHAPSDDHKASRRSSTLDGSSYTPTPYPADEVKSLHSDGSAGGCRSSEPDRAFLSDSSLGFRNRHPHRTISERIPGSNSSTPSSPLLPLDLASVQAAGAVELTSTASYGGLLAAGLPVHASPDGNEDEVYLEDGQSRTMYEQSWGFGPATAWGNWNRLAGE
ncbi:BQ2448_372 [Microbotryum intermedium]|uniref:BQ2448_372 protein n=1 Tax=Microbotryum intermedium TaxID=269621 RepID=A0A238F834_9BASI|nr:BQ2448_372 [Microbotryum intermedium]